jgi:hypothetical protein
MESDPIIGLRFRGSFAFRRGLACFIVAFLVLLVLFPFQVKVEKGRAIESHLADPASERFRERVSNGLIPSLGVGIAFGLHGRNGQGAFADQRFFWG